MKPFPRSRIFKRSIICAHEKVAFAAQLKSTKIAVFQNVRKRIFVISQTMVIWNSATPRTSSEDWDTFFWRNTQRVSVIKAKRNKFEEEEISTMHDTRNFFCARAEAQTEPTRGGFMRSVTKKIKRTQQRLISALCSEQHVSMPSKLLDSEPNMFAKLLDPGPDMFAESSSSSSSSSSSK